MPLISAVAALSVAASGSRRRAWIRDVAHDGPNMRQRLAIMDAVRACDAPVIPRASLNVRRSGEEDVHHPRVAAA